MVPALRNKPYEESLMALGLTNWWKGDLEEI